jgi:replicative DNA helicase
MTLEMARTSVASSPHAVPLGRVPPHNLEAEQSVLGSMMLSKSVVAEVMEILRPEDFYREAHQRICEATRDLFASGEPVDAVTVAEELRRRTALEQVGGAPYIHTLVSAVPIASNAAFYARIVVEHATLRRLIDAATLIAQECYEVPDDIDEAINRAGELIYTIAARRIHQDFSPIRELLALSMDQLEMLSSHQSEVVGVPTGFRDLDSRLSGLQKQNLVLVAARPAMGKSSFVMNIAHHAALNQAVPVAIFSLEMSQMEIVQRLICAEARVDTSRLRKGSLTDADWIKVSNAVGRLDTAPIFIDDTASISMMEIRAKCQRLKKRENLGLVIVDYIQLMTSPRRTENRVQEVSDISRSLKILAKELDVPVLAVSQLSRQPEQGGGDKRPHLAHLRESGALEQDADVVMFLYREEYYNPDTPDKGEAEVIVAKHRNGPVGTERLAFLGQYTKFADLARS